MQIMAKKIQDPKNLSSLSECKLCPNLGVDHVASIGNTTASVFVLLNAPHIRQVDKGTLLAGPSLELFELLFSGADIEMSDVYFAAAIKCCPPNRRNARPPELLMCYNTWLKKEIINVDPRVLILVGRDAHLTIYRSFETFKHGYVGKTKGGRKTISIQPPNHWITQGNVEPFLDIGYVLKDMLDGTDDESKTIQ
jgi:uracil-DNA glycosylase family 4